MYLYTKKPKTSQPKNNRKNPETQQPKTNQTQKATPTHLKTTQLHILWSQKLWYAYKGRNSFVQPAANRIHQFQVPNTEENPPRQTWK